MNRTRRWSKLHLGLSATLWVGLGSAGCGVYDGDLLQQPLQATPDAASPSVHCSPGADASCPEPCPEICDQRDNDCDGMVDEDSDRSCELAQARSACDRGACVVIECLNDHANCDGVDANGCEADLKGVGHCGACGMRCEAPNALMTCSDGRCQVAGCDPGYADCNSSPSDGCERALGSLEHCAACGDHCQLAHASQRCETGVCHLIECNPGHGDCDGDAANGCETLLTTLSNCGGCGMRCEVPGGTASCALGRCETTMCPNGLADCDRNGDCETSLTLAEHCGGCGVLCDLANALEGCDAGSCELVRCEAGFGNCDGDDTNGCETRLDTALACGGCGMACELPRATAGCVAGACAVSACEPGFGDCDGLAANGCEVALSDPNNCGACGKTCDDADPCTADTCVAGQCVHLDSGQCTCPTSCPGGNCGSCGPACPCDLACRGQGTCSSTCSAGATCKLAVSSAGSGRQTCRATSTCTLTCNSVNSCTQTCQAGASCELSCSSASCSLDCQATAQCLISSCSGGSCQLQCPGGATDCGSSVRVCNRACP